MSCLITFISLLLAITTASAMDLDQYLEQSNIRSAGFVIARQNGITYHLYPEAFNITVTLGEQEYISVGGQPITFNETTWEDALLNRGMLHFVSDTAYDKAVANADYNKRYPMKVINFFAQEYVMNHRAYPNWLSTGQLLTGIHDLIYNHVHDNGTRDPHDNVIPVGGIGYLRMVNGDLKSDWNDFGLNDLWWNFGSRVGLPQAAVCLRITSQGNQRGWTIAYGMDRDAVMGLPCYSYTTQEKDVNIDLPERLVKQ